MFMYEVLKILILTVACEKISLLGEHSLMYFFLLKLNWILNEI